MSAPFIRELEGSFHCVRAGYPRSSASSWSSARFHLHSTRQKHFLVERRKVVTNEERIAHLENSFVTLTELAQNAGERGLRISKG